MISHVHKIIKLIILIIVVYTLAGCVAKNQEVNQNQETFQDQEELDNLDTTIDLDADQEPEEPEQDASISITSDDEELVDDIIITDAPDNSLADSSEKETEAVVSGIPSTVSDKEEVDENWDETVELIFEETSETVYATANVNIRSEYTTNVDNVVSILMQGTSIKRIGLQEEWSKVMYKNEVCYMKTTYLTTKKPVADAQVTVSPTPSQNEDSDHSSDDNSETNFVENLDIASDINQLVCVIGEGSSNCTVSFHIKDEDGSWKQQFSTTGEVGSKGISYNKREGDKKTPAGLFSFTLAFGLKSDPGSILPYRKITEYDYWVDDVDSPHYNTWVNTQENPGEYKGEHLIEHDPSYTYALNISYNSERAPGLGSAVFLHCFNGKGYTTGCIAISEKSMKTLIQEIDSSTMILIVPNIKDLANY
jgi:L,D-peptidoglycan transpeptidase YkuD (ErfK/YbiS/YcfS/YnhG family)